MNLIIYSSNRLLKSDKKTHFCFVKNPRAIIVDDELSARDILSNLLKYNCPHVEIVDACSDIEEAVKSIRKHQPDLVFLDIEMPNFAGYEIGQFFEKLEFEIIFVTAYDSYAVKAFELSAVDYLLKPIEIDRLKSAVKKFEEKRLANQAMNYQVLLETLESEMVKKFVVTVNAGQKVLNVDDVIAIKASESYSDILTIDGSTYTYSKNLKHFENLLEKNPNFVRTHKSWLVNTNFIKSYSKSQFIILLENGIEAKLSKYKKEEFEKMILS